MISFLCWKLLRPTLCNFQVCDTLSLTRVTMLCVISPWLVYNCKFVPFNPLHPCWLPTQTPHLETTNLFPVFMFCSSWLLFDSTFKCGHGAFVFLGLTSYSIMRSRFIHVITNSKISLWLVHNQYIKNTWSTFTLHTLIVNKYLIVVCVSDSLSHEWLLATPWPVAHQAPPSMEFSRQQNRSGLPCPPARDLPNPGIELRSCSLPVDSLTSEPPGKPLEDDKRKTKTRQNKKYLL